ncbi:MAG: ATP-binding protein, partial [Bacteroidaceae bacterium]|nr:ATP-binding protein [Paraprevotella sp.]MDY2716117.1 ATP-binding protein [Bacteroidaceae bacterium]
MQWIDRMRQVKILLVAMAVVMSVGSLVISHFLVRDLKREEQRKMEIWAEAMRSLNSADEYTDL